jgi:hypothetical protein
MVVRKSVSRKGVPVRARPPVVRRLVTFGLQAAFGVAANTAHLMFALSFTFVRRF